LHSFVDWLASTPPSIALAKSSWIVPTTQTVHIVAIAILFSSVLMVGLRLMGWAGRGQTLEGTVARFGPWFWGALIVLALTGTILIVIEPRRELLTISFWLKMSALAVAIAIAVVFLRRIDRKAGYGEDATRPRTKLRRVVSLFVWCLVIFLGRVSAYDSQVWGGFSPLY